MGCMWAGMRVPQVWETAHDAEYVQRGEAREILLAMCLEESIWSRAGLWTREQGGLVEEAVGGSERP